MKAKSPKITPSEKKCVGCLQVKPIDDFGIRTLSADGHVARCKACASMQCHRYRKTEPRIITVTVTHKQCNRCKRIKLASEFRPSKALNSKDGLYHLCHSCLEIKGQRQAARMAEGKKKKTIEREMNINKQNLLQALRYSTLTDEQIYERFDNDHIAGLAKEGLIESVRTPQGRHWNITEAGLNACPRRNPASAKCGPVRPIPLSVHGPTIHPNPRDNRLYHNDR